MSLTVLTVIATFCALCGLFTAAYYAYTVLEHPVGTEKMAEISRAIQEGCKCLSEQGI